MRGNDRSVVSFTRADRFAIEPVPWLIEDWLVKDTLAGLVGPSGTCKSFLAIDWACRVATGTSWCGRRVEQGAVFLIAGEGRSGLRKRIAGWERDAGVSVNGAPLFFSDCLPPLADAGIASAVVEKIAVAAEELYADGGAEPALVIIDTVARAMAGFNENNSDDMGRLVQGMDWIRQRWGACVLSVHHTGHEARDRARGSSAYRAALDSEFLTTADAAAVHLRGTKGKDWPCPMPIALARHVVQIPTPCGDTTTLVLRNAQAVAQDERDRLEQVIRLHLQGLTYREIAEATGVKTSTAQRWVEKSKKPDVPSHPL